MFIDKKPIRSEKIYYGRQWVDKNDIIAVDNVLTSDLITCGPKVKELKQYLADLTDSRHAVAV